MRVDNLRTDRPALTFPPMTVSADMGRATSGDHAWSSPPLPKCRFGLHRPAAEGEILQVQKIAPVEGTLYAISGGLMRKDNLPTDRPAPTVPFMTVSADRAEDQSGPRLVTIPVPEVRFGLHRPAAEGEILQVKGMSRSGAF